MAHFCGFIKLIFLLLMLARIPSNETRPLKGNSQANSDLIAGNEFLKLFMDHEQVDKDFYSSEYVGGGGSGSDNIRESRNIQKDSTESKSRKDVVEVPQKEKNYDKKSAETGRRSSSGRSLKDKGPKLNQAEGQLEDSKQVVKLVTSGSKIVFLEDYDENDAILDAEARDIDLKKEIFKQKSQTNLDDYKVVAVSVSSSSQRGTTTAKNRLVDTTTTTSSKYERKPLTTQKSTTPATTKSLTTNKVYVSMTPKTPTVTTTNISKISELSTMEASPTKIDTTAGDNFINRSHKSEFSIEEVEPLTMTQHKSRKLHSRHRSYPVTSVSDTLDVLDSENSASTNIHNILAAPLQPSASARSTSMVTTTYENGQRNMTINHDSNLHVEKSRHKSATATNVNDDKSADNEKQHIVTGSGGGVEDQLLPFQTVIYHDTKAGHGPQSRSISYSSISQNIEDLKKWQQSGIIAEARRNVSESLKPMPRSNTSSTVHQSEPAKFYSQPSKMYGEPSKFYSEPAKVYSEPAKVYGEAEKFYSEPAKVYGQPSKFYSEPAKVYSQPAKVYSEPAKTYWPVQTATTSTSTHSPSTIIPPTIAPTITTTVPIRHTIHQSSRKPAIVSRIAFGEAHLTSSTTTTTTSTTTTPAPSTSTPTRTFGQHHYSRTYSSHRNPSSSSSILVSNENSSSSSSSQSSSSTPSRRILFNLDRLPYDLLNAPEPSIQQQQLLELQKTKRPQQTPSSTYQESKQQQQLQSKQKQRHNINPCLESAVSTLFSSSSLSAHPAVLKQRQQNPSLSDQQQQHSNQNAKGLPNGDLVRCVAEISHTPAVGNDDSDDTGAGVDTFTTERSHLEELFTPTPEQNYEIEEAVSVMTNGRAHGSGVGGRNSLALPTTSPIHQQQHHGFKPNRQRTRVHFGTNVNNPTEVDDGGHQQQHHHYNNNANVNGETNNNNNRHHSAPDYTQYDEGDDGGDGDGATNNNDYNDDGGSPANANAEEGNADDEDSKVAYIVEGHNYRKYRVEEETDDGFIVGEYGVVDHNDGNLRGVRYTADSTINRSLIQKALLTFLKLK